MTTPRGITVHDGAEPIGEGTHIRAPIDLIRFNTRLAAKAREP